MQENEEWMTTLTQGNSTEEEELEHERNMEALEVRLDLIGSELEDLQSKLPAESDDDDTQEASSEAVAVRAIGSLGAPEVRRLLWDMLGKFSRVEVRHANIVCLVVVVVCLFCWVLSHTHTSCCIARTTVTVGGKRTKGSNYFWFGTRN